MESVFILHHVHSTNDDEDIKLIGAFSSLELAMNAVKLLSFEPGFKDNPRLIDTNQDDFSSGFFVDEYTINDIHWREGFATVLDV